MESFGANDCGPPQRIKDEPEKEDSLATFVWYLDDV